MHRIVFMGTPDFAVPVLHALLATQQVVGVVTQPDRPAGRGQTLRFSPVKVVAEAAGVPVYQPASLRRPERAAQLQAWAPEAIVVAAFGQILRPHLLELPPLGCINVHASLLPRWRGASPIQHALLAGDAETGVSLMRMDAGLDTGPWYVQQSLPIAADETAATLHDKLAQLGGEMIRRYLPDILAGRLPLHPQDDQQATYAPLIAKEAGEIRWSQPAAAIDRLIRAMTPWPGAFTFWNGQLLKIHTARPQSGGPVAAPSGTTLQLTDGGIGVAAGVGYVQLETVQLAGRRAMSAQEFVRGQPDFVGQLLGRQTV